MNQLPPGHISLIDDQSKKLLPLFLITQHNLNKESVMFKHYPLRQHTYFILLKVSLNQEGGSVIPSLLKNGFGSEIEEMLGHVELFLNMLIDTQIQVIRTNYL